MKQEIKQKWVKALRSGKYKQGEGRLKQKDTFCCLGVLCDLYRKETGEPWEKDEYGSETMLNEESFLPPTVKRWAGIRSKTHSPKVRSPFVKETKRPYVALSELNDGEVPGIKYADPYDFKQIADLIDRNY
jgi:hypothetical protein